MIETDNASIDLSMGTKKTEVKDQPYEHPYSPTPVAKSLKDGEEINLLCLSEN